MLFFMPYLRYKIVILTQNYDTKNHSNYGFFV